MRKALFTYTNKLYSLEKIKEINLFIDQNLHSSQDYPAAKTTKTSEVKFIHYGKLNRYLIPFTQFCLSSNKINFGFDLHPLTFDEVINYNIYKKNTEYDWHIDAELEKPLFDIKLTCLLNCSDGPYEGGDLCLFSGKERACKEFNEPGSIIVFPSFINHRVKKVTSGERKTLAIWWSGPKFR